MFVLCNNCHNHYDDECQSKKCAGPGVHPGSRGEVSSSHKMLKPNTAADDHADNVRLTRPKATLERTETMDNSETKVYITGKISGLEEAEYLSLFAEAATFLESHGFIPVNPIEVEAECGEACNSGLIFQDGRYMHTWQCYMRYDIKALMDCQAILPLDNASDSRGAKLEMQLAEQVGLVLMKRDGDELSWSMA